MNELCPFCGKQAVEIENGEVTCEDPECMGYDVMFPIEQWQSRPLEDALRKLLDERNYAFGEHLKELDRTVAENAALRKQLEVAKEVMDNVLQAYDDANKDDSQLPNKLAQKMCDIVEDAWLEIKRIGKEK